MKGRSNDAPPDGKGGSRKPSSVPPLPSADGFMSTAAKMSLADLAMQLRDEQIQARVVHYKADLVTSPELDAVTAQVVAELQQLQMLQQQARHPQQSPSNPSDPKHLEKELVKSLTVMLGKLFRPDKVPAIVERKIAEASKRFARIFFESELHEKIRGSKTETKIMRFSDQALFHVFARNETFLKRQLEAFDYSSKEVLENAREKLGDLMKELRDSFLSRTTPELNALVKYLNEVLVQFCTLELPPHIPTIALEVVQEAKLADAQVRAGYKISADGFPAFRVAFERRFVVRLVSFASDEMLRRVRESPSNFRSETIRFVADPQIFSDICELICNAVYDHLYNDGFLDLPGDWRGTIVTS